MSSRLPETRDLAAGPRRRRERQCDRRGGRVPVLQNPPEPHEQVEENEAIVIDVSHGI